MSRPDILVPAPMREMILDGLAPHFTLHRLYEAEDRDAMLAAVADRIRGIAISFRPVDKALVDRLPKLEIVANFGVGYDNVDAAYCGTKGVIVTNTPDVLTDEVADTAIALMIMTVRELPAAERWLREGRWKSQGPFPLTRGTLRGRTLGILGLGRIGKAIATRAEAFGMAIHYHNRSRQADVPYTYHPSLVSLAEAVDTLMLVAPGGEETRHMVGERVLEALGPEGVLINIGRGSVVNEAALAAALRQGTILAAGLDVFENEPQVPQALLDLPNAVLLPHVGSASVATRNAMGQLVVDNLVGWFRDGRVLTPVAETPVPAMSPRHGA
ncbi:2-hydroxyacid dehydrogenase [Microvirga tunisiensis]|uniref:2-hydroxyacid dehydrogenase n=2 Tax=Pannonibacter tanglangensis TaxID=2750084 RepID=A0ABW9ZKG1_9HYPH|nr:MULTISPECIES: 2-hydroxyacid dehydrogenase [unclassified Pannonibacter]NBN65374.1 2-hydroxyacid dehydrogenase [Pannonibacter sp. XCT-34]NBN79649.1 2-hydroxyacid dehydrogenase [Pannonibacter sp. XCT-53]